MSMRIEKLNESYLCREIYKSNNTKVIKNIKNTGLATQCTHENDKRMLAMHYEKNKVIHGFSITMITNKKYLVTFIRMINIKIISNVNNENKELIYIYIKNEMHKYTK